MLTNIIVVFVFWVSKLPVAQNILGSLLELIERDTLIFAYSFNGDSTDEEFIKNFPHTRARIFDEIYILIFL